MKNVILSILALFLVVTVYSQTMVHDPSKHIEDKVQDFNFDNNTAKANKTTDWFNYAREITNISSSMPYYRGTLFPDSTVQVEFSNGMGYVWNHSHGQVLDPTSNFFIFDSKAISKSATYTVDSIALPYRYNRPRNQAPDTLVIQFFTHSQLTFVETPSWTTPKSYARAPYDYTVRKGDNPAKEITIILDNNDTTTAVAGIIQEAVNMSVAADEKFAVTYTYFPGSTVNVDDTVDFYMSPPPGNPANSFLIYYFQDEAPTIDNGYYNHAKILPTTVRYNDTANTNGWEGSYIPGVAYFAGNYQSDIFFQLTYDDFTGIADEDFSETLEVFPNPANSEVTVAYESISGNRAVLEFTDMIGNKVHEQVLDVNNNKTYVNIANWNNGIYFYSLKVDGDIRGAARLVVAK